MELQRNTAKSKISMIGFLRLLKNLKFQQIIIAIVIFLIIYGFVSTSITPQKYNLIEGDVATVDIICPRDVRNAYATENAVKRAISGVDKVYTPDSSVQIQVIKDVDTFFNKVFEIKSLTNVDDKVKAERLKSESSITLAQDDYTSAVKANIDDLKSLKEEIVVSLNQIFDQIINDNEQDLKSKKQDFSYSMANLKLNKELRDLGTNIGFALIKPNKVYDGKATDEKIRIVREKTESEPVMIKKNQKIVDKGHVVTEENISILKSLGLLEKQGKIDFTLYIGIGILIALMESIIIFYLYRFSPDILNSLNKLILICLVITIELLFAKFISVYNVSGFLIPTSFASMLLTILIKPRLAMMLNIALSTFVALMLGYNIDIFMVALIGGSIGAIIVSKMHQRSDLVTAGIVVSAVNVLAILGTSLTSSADIIPVMKQSTLGLLNGALSSIFTLGMLPFCEAIFGIVTPLKLLELSNPNQPLLKRLLFDAPGTYHHSIIVGNLAESASDTIGCNSLLARVGSYYHDIGKLKRPYFFKENQLSDENPHDIITPSLSTLIITSHINDGVKIGKEYKLPEVIIDIIKQHHGTTLVKYFYVKAIKDADGVNNVKERQFRYEGPKPKSREAAIILLADSVEAAVRSISYSSKQEIEDMIRKIIKDKIEDGQLDESTLTLRDINNIIISFLNVLNGIYHERVEYPELPESYKGGE